MGTEYAGKVDSLTDKHLIIDIQTLAQMKIFANLFALCLNQAKIVIILEGDLGAGKTTLVRSILQCLGCTDQIKSPTYNLVHQYQVLTRNIYHLDLYRTQSRDDLVHIDLQDFILGDDGLIFIEWGECKGIKADLIVKIKHVYELEELVNSNNQEQRIINITAESNAGLIVVNLLTQMMSMI